MTKILLVEDEKALREIYGVRLLAEGYDIVSAKDGEEALAMAIKERPALVITDVMMPKISGFDMLDILRSTTETRDIKVIVMTALGSNEQRIRGEKLGADRYLVKSQVGIEDVVRTVHEVLNDAPAPAQPQAMQPPATMARPMAAAMPPNPMQQRPYSAPPVAQPMVQPPMRPVVPPNYPPSSPVSPVNPYPAQSPQPVRPPQAAPAPPPATAVPAAPPMRNKVIQPLSPAVAKVDINDLLDRELAREAGIDITEQSTVTTADERQYVQRQLNQFSAAPNPGAPASNGEAPTIEIDARGNVRSSQPNQGTTPPPPPPPVQPGQ